MGWIIKEELVLEVLFVIMKLGFPDLFCFTAKLSSRKEVGMQRGVQMSEQMNEQPLVDKVETVTVYTITVNGLRGLGEHLFLF